MSGHSKWSKVKNQKAVTDVKKGQIFSKLANLISVASREGTDPETNPKLRKALEMARQFSMPKENINRAISRGADKNQSNLEEVIIEAYGPYGSALIIMAVTDNRNRTLAEVRKILEHHNAKPGQSGSVKYMFKEVARIYLSKDSFSDPLALAIIESGGEDIKEEEDKVVITAPALKLPVLRSLIEKETKIENIELDYEPDQNYIIKISQPEQKAELEKLFEELDNHPDVNEIYSNIKFEENG
jgi:YebC/PmpR family DNA-binding regulatory protein